MLTVRDSSSRLREVESHRIYSVLHSSQHRFTYSTGIPPVSRGFTPIILVTHMRIFVAFDRRRADTFCVIIKRHKIKAGREI